MPIRPAGQRGKRRSSSRLCPSRFGHPSFLWASVSPSTTWGRQARPAEPLGGLGGRASLVPGTTPGPTCVPSVTPVQLRPRRPGHTAPGAGAWEGEGEAERERSPREPVTHVLPQRTRPPWRGRPGRRLWPRDKAAVRPAARSSVSALFSFFSRLFLLLSTWVFSRLEVTVRSGD